MKKFDEWWDLYEFHPSTIDEAFEDAFKAGRAVGLLEAADIADSFKPAEHTHPHAPTAISKAIRDILERSDD
jgi:predicted component of type VI protein secretion system